MATQGRGSTRPRGNRNLKYFFLNDDLYRVLRVVRAEDFVEVWNFTQGKRQALVWSEVRKHHDKAFTLAEVCKMIGKTRETIEHAILDGRVNTPQRIYTLDLERTPGKYLFSEKDVMGLHDYYLTVHIGRPRRDGKITPSQMPTKAELRAMMRHDTVLYVQNKDGEFVPVWKEVDW